MAAILESLSVRISLSATCALLAVMAIAHKADGEWMPITESEIGGFYNELSLAGQRCDAEWLANSFLPNSTITIRIDGRADSMVDSMEQYLLAFRQVCRLRSGSPRFEEIKTSLQVRPDQAVLETRWAKGGMWWFDVTARLLGISTGDIASLKGHDVIVRGDDGSLKFEEFSTTVQLSGGSLATP